MKKLASILLALVMVLAMAVPAMADPANQGKTKYDEWNGTVIGKEITLNKHMLIKEAGIMPDVTFTYELTINDAVEAGKVLIPATDTTAVVYNGIELDKIKVLDKAYEEIEPDKLLGTLPYDNDDTSDGHKGTACALDNHDVPDGFECWTQPITIDFTGVTFTEPGIYRYYLQESSDLGLVQNDIDVSGTDNTWRTIDVYVVDDEEDSHKLLNENGGTTAEPKPVHYIVYEGKLDNTKAPKINPKDYTDPDDYDPTRNLSENKIADTTWTYVKTEDDGLGFPLGTYEYTYNKTEKQWEEKHKADPANPGDPPVETINRNLTTYLKDATGIPTGKTYTPATYGEAVAMGADERLQLQGNKWTWRDANGVKHTYEWDSTVNPASWKHTATKTSAPVDEPDKDAEAEVTIKSDNTKMTYTYEEAKRNQNYIDGELTKYDWVLTNSNDGSTTTYKWDAQISKWTVTIVTENNEEPNDAATPDSSFTVTPVKYSYVYEKERQAQIDAGYNIKASENPNGAEAGEKTNNYKNRFAAYDLEVGKKVTGNQGSRDKYFKFTIEINASAKTNAANEIIAAGHKITVDRTNMTLKEYDATADYPEYPNAATTHKTKDIRQANSNNGLAADPTTDVYTIGSDGKVKITVYLHDGEKIVLKDIPEGATYTVTEDDANSEGYKASVEMLPGAGGYNNDMMTNDGDNDASNDAAIDVSAGNKVEDKALMANAGVLFTNERNGVIPTGVVIGVGGAVVLMALAGAYFVLRRKLSVDED